MSYSNSANIIIVQDRPRGTSVGTHNSSASRSSWASTYSSPSSGGGSGSSSNTSHGSTRYYRDPDAGDNLIDVKEKTGRRGDVVTINHKKPNPAYNEPTPSYGASSRYINDHTDRERR